MYAVVQKSSSGTRMTGVITTALVFAGVSFVLANGIGQEFTPVEEKISVLEFIEAPPEVVVKPPPVEAPPIEITSPPPPVFEAPEFVPPEAEAVIAAEPAAVPDVPPGPAVPVMGSDRVAPKLRAAVEPPYPSASRRAQEEGVSGIEVCVDARGRVTSASLARSSGHQRLDSAAMQWIREARFTPGSVGGAPQPMCGHRVDYEWRLDA